MRAGSRYQTDSSHWMEETHATTQLSSCISPVIAREDQARAQDVIYR